MLGDALGDALGIALGDVLGDALGDALGDGLGAQVVLGAGEPLCAVTAVNGASIERIFCPFENSLRSSRADAARIGTLIGASNGEKLCSNCAAFSESFCFSSTLSERFGGAPAAGAIVSVVAQAEMTIGRFAGSSPLSLLLTSVA